MASLGKRKRTRQNKWDGVQKPAGSFRSSRRFSLSLAQVTAAFSPISGLAVIFASVSSLDGPIASLLYVSRRSQGSTPFTQSHPMTC